MAIGGEQWEALVLADPIVHAVWLRPPAGTCKPNVDDAFVTQIGATGLV
jgi:hypothetical protein